MDYAAPPDPLATLLSGFPAFAFALRDGAFGLLSVTDGVRNLTGFEARDLLATPDLFVSRLSPESKKALARLAGRPSNGAVPTWEFRLRCADERTRTFKARLAKGHGPPGDPDAVLGIALATEEERSARRRADEAISILQAAGAVLFFTDVDGKVRMWNDSSERFFGWTREEMVGSAVHRVFPVPKEVVDSLLDGGRNGTTVSHAVRLRTKSGAETDCRITASRVAGAHGVPAGTVVSVADAAERTSLQDRLRRTITRLRTIERVNRVIASDWDLGKVYARIAQELRQLVDFDRTSVTLLGEADDPVVLSAVSGDRIAAGPEPPVPLDRSAPGWVLAHRIVRIDPDLERSPDRFAEDGALLRDGIRSRMTIPLFAGERIVGTLSFYHRSGKAYSPADVDGLGSIPDQMAMAIEKHRMVARLRASEEKYRLLFEQGPPAATAGPDGRFLDVNDELLRLYGYSREEFLRLAVGDLSASPDLESPFETVRRTGAAADAEVRQLRKDGTDFQGRLNVFPVSEELVLGQITDVTEQRQLEEQLRHIQRMDAVGTLAGGIAHDFNNIIQTILGYAAVAKARACDTGVGAEEIDAVERAGLRASELTAQLLGFARRGKYEVRPVDLNRVVDKVVSMVRHTFDRSIEIRTDLSPELPAVEGDAGQMEQTVLNLCINARDAMPEGGTLLLATQREEVAGDDAAAPGAPPPGPYVCLRLSDTGVGIPPENIPRIFEPFFTTKETGKGSGMGLAMVYGIVKNHGGFLSVESVPNEGTEFRLLLPASAREARPAAEPAREEPAARGTETILFVDDEESLQSLADQMLSRLGYRVLTAGNGADAVRIFRERHPEIAVVILDLVMPGMGGEEAFRQLKEIDPSARILLSSGYAMEGRPRSLLAAGAAGFLQKPYRLGDLGAALRRVIGEGGA